MQLEIDEDNLKEGLLSLVIALVEVIEDTLIIQARRRMESGMLDPDEIERLGQALMDLNIALTAIKEEHDLTDTVSSVREGLDDIVDDVLDRLANPERWGEEGTLAGVRGGR